MSRVILDPRPTDTGAEFHAARIRRGRRPRTFTSPPAPHVVELRREAGARPPARRAGWRWAMIAALYVATGGAYFGLPDVDPWDEARDARLYVGKDPVVAHPPCSRWCRLAGLVEARWGHKRGDDGGCFASALANVRRVGGGLGASCLL